MQALVTFAIVVAVASVLALPAIVAIVRKHPSWIAITFLTAVLGWTGLGWIAALVWARGSTERRRRTRIRKVKRAGAIRRAAPAVVPAYAGANDNSSAPAMTDLVPDIVASDVYEDWLEQGEALLAETGRIAEPAPAPRVAPTGLAA